VPILFDVRVTFSPQSQAAVVTKPTLERLKARAEQLADEQSTADDSHGCLAQDSPNQVQNHSFICK
jgi:hypothetical protein